MKKLLVLITMLTCLSVNAKDFKTPFYDLLDKGDLELAEILLSEWEKSDTNNPNLVLARFNLYLNKASKSGVVPNRNEGSESVPLIIEDPMESNDGVVEWNDSLFQLSVDAIDKGIALFPNRLDFRLAKASAYDYRNDMDALSEAAVDILELSRINGRQWQWTEDSLLLEDKAKEILLDYLHDFERTMVEHSYNNRLLDLNLEYYPEDHVALTLKGSIEYEAGRMEDAQKYLERAYRVSPEDPLIVSNLAYISFAMGDRDKAEALYTAVIESDKADDESKEAAKNMISRMKGKLKEIDLYSFEFQFLPMFARELKPGDTALEILCNKQYIIGIILPENGYSIPVDISEIKVDKIGNGDDAIVVWTMPEPKKIPLARYIAFVPDMAGDNYNVYTLERSLDWDGNGPLWVLGLTRRDEHSNFGDITYPETPEEFVNWIMKVANTKKQ